MKTTGKNTAGKGVVHTVVYKIPKDVLCNLGSYLQSVYKISLKAYDIRKAVNL
jgi:hypothetical protein